MAKITRNKKQKSPSSILEDGKVINLETGEVSTPLVPVWPVSLQTSFAKCVSLVEKIKDRTLNLVDETNITTICYSLACFGERGKSLFDQICLFQNKLSTKQLADIWGQALEKSTLKSPFKFVRICKEKGIDIKISESDEWEYKLIAPGQIGQVERLLGEEELTDKEREEIHEFGFLEREHCYYFGKFDFDKKICMLYRRSNFVLRILFHINRGKQNKRVIEMINVKGRKLTLDIETKQLSSFQPFKELIEGQGNFSFKGSAEDLDKIKSKLFDLEKPSKQIDMLGWHNEGKFFAFCNGLYTDKFNPVDEHGIVSLNDKHYFIPYHPGTDDSSHVNEKLFFYKHSNVTFEQWSPLYCQAFGRVGEVALVFGIATLFSDHIFSVLGNFPIKFLYGEAGSGKSRVGMFLQYFWGSPQPPLKIGERANTDKSKIRKLAEFVNAMIQLEEYTNVIDISNKKSLTGIYDRFGYERSNLDSRFGTETVPINSTVIMTGNEYPDDDALMQRIILFDYHANRRDDKVNKAYDALKLLNREGLTEITGRLLQLRPEFVKRWERYFRPQCDAFKNRLVERNITVPDRMIENYTVLIATAKVVMDIGLKLPFKLDDMIKFLVDTIVAQALKRDTGSITQQWWDIVLQVANQNLIRYNREYVVQGDNENPILSIRFTEIYNFYQDKFVSKYHRSAPPKNSILQKLRESGTMVSPDSKDMRLGTSNPTSVFQFYHKKIGVDLERIGLLQEEQRKRMSVGQPTQPTENWLETSNSQNDHDNDEKTEKPRNQPENDKPPF